MDKLNFYLIDLEYARFLAQAEQEKRGFSRIPNLDYGTQRHSKFLCGIVLQVNGMDYYVPVSSYKIQKPDNFVITDKNGKPVSSLRFNYMFPIPKGLAKIRRIDTEPDQSYRALLSQELQSCIKNQEKIRYLAERTYRRVLLCKDKGLVMNSCDFRLLEEKCLEYCRSHGLESKE